MDDIGQKIVVKCISKLEKKKFGSASYGPVAIGGFAGLIVNDDDSYGYLCCHDFCEFLLIFCELLC